MPITTPITPRMVFNTDFPASPTEDIFSPTDSIVPIDQFEPNLHPTVSKVDTLNFVEGICEDFTPPRDVSIPHKIVSILSTIADNNALPLQPGNIYTVFEHAGMICNLENAVRTLDAGGTVNIKTAICNPRNELIISPEVSTIKDFNDLIQWDSI